MCSYLGSSLCLMTLHLQNLNEDRLPVGAFLEAEGTPLPVPPLDGRDEGRRSRAYNSTRPLPSPHGEGDGLVFSTDFGPRTLPLRRGGKAKTGE